MNITNLQSEIKKLEDNVSSLNGKTELLESQYIDLQEKQSILKENQIIISQAIELLNIIQSANKEIIKSVFENIVTKALNFINQSNDYKFELEFDTRGNLPTLRFLLKTPRMKEAHDILDCNCGGDKDVVSVALRHVLLEVSKTPGFLFLDEIDKRLDSPETEQKMLEFIQELQKETNRQVLLITHSQRVVDSVPNPIIFKSQPIVKKEVIEKVEEKPKKGGRGRPRKEKIVECRGNCA
jgi:DNA repair exonuclease SbcCD ATPase subunit